MTETIRKRITVGDEFKLKCGTVVTVTARTGIEDKACVYVVDKEGNGRKMNRTSLKDGTARWPWRRDPSAILIKPRYVPRGYYVYVGTAKGKIYYVGQGSAGRFNHLIDGRSQNELINRHFFLEENKLVVEIVKDDLTREEAIDLERRIIFALQPPYNKTGGVPHSDELKRMYIDGTGSELFNECYVNEKIISTPFYCGQ